MNEFKILDEFKKQLDEFYDIAENQQEEQHIDLLEQINENIEFTTQTGFCRKCKQQTTFSVFTIHHKQEIQCNKCKTKYERKLND